MTERKAAAAVEAGRSFELVLPPLPPGAIRYTVYRTIQVTKPLPLLPRLWARLRGRATTYVETQHHHLADTPTREEVEAMP